MMMSVDLRADDVHELAGQVGEANREEPGQEEGEGERGERRRRALEEDLDARPCFLQLKLRGLKWPNRPSTLLSYECKILPSECSRDPTSGDASRLALEVSPARYSYTLQ